MGKEQNIESEESLEQLLEQAKQLADRLEEEDLPLEQAFLAYEEGMRLVKRCNEKIDAVEQKMQVMTADGSLTDFDQES